LLKSEEESLNFTQLTKEKILAAPQGEGLKASLIDGLKSLVGSNLIGGTSASGAATSIVSNGIVPMVLGTAIEQGALTQSIQGTVATLRTILYGLWKFAAGQEPYCLDRECKNAVDFARRVSFSAGFNPSQGSERSTTATAASGTARPTLDLRLASLRQQFGPLQHPL
jgi:hypothetical protein